MEQWERDYIETVSESKKEIEKAKGHLWAYEEGYDSSRWMEVIQPDGTKYYIPKDDFFIQETVDQQRNKRKKVQHRSEKRKFVRLLLAGVMLLCVLFKTIEKSPLEMTPAHVEGQHSLESIIQGKLLGGTYVDGLGFARMMSFFEDMQEERQDFLTEIAQSVNNFSAVDTEKWTAIFAERGKQLERLRYAISYEQYVQAQKKTFEEEKELLILLRHGAEAHTVLDLYYQLAGADLELRREAMAAMDKNGIEYTLEDVGFTYWYKNY